MVFDNYNGTSDKGPSEKKTISLSVVGTPEPMGACPIKLPQV